MSWRAGSKLFADIWPLVQNHIPDDEFRVEFTARLLGLFVEQDMDPYDIEDLHPEIRDAMRLAGMEITERDRYKLAPATDDETTTPRRPWWKLW